MAQYNTDNGAQLSEIRWGDSKQLDLAIPALSTAQAVTPFFQLADVRVPHAAAGTVLVGLEWLNFAAGIVPEVLMRDSFVRVGVGSTEWATSRGVGVPAGGFLPIADLIIPEIPSTRMSLSGRLRVQLPVSGAARTYTARIVLLAAPYGRLRGVDYEDLDSFEDEGRIVRAVR